jgi:hypothetical protein
MATGTTPKNAANDMTAAAAEDRGPEIQGRMDAIDGRRLFGWAWDASRPDDRLAIRVLLDGREIGTTVADRPRADLQRNGVGDGAHAFEFSLPDNDADVSDRLSVVAVSPSTGKETPLRRPSEMEIAAEAVAAVPLRRATDLLEALMAAQRRFHSVQQAALQSLKETADKVDAIGAAGTDGVAQAIDAVRSTQDSLEKRLAEIEVFQLRFDQTLGDLDKRIQALHSSADRPLRRAVAALGVFVALVAGIAIYAVALQTMG